MLRYRLRTTTVAVHPGPQGIPAIFVPPGSILKAPDDFLNTTGFVEVEWDGKNIQMFAVDLRDHGELVQVDRDERG